MPVTLRHIIRQQHLHVTVDGTESDGLALQRSLPSVCQHWMTPAIERTLESCAPQVGHLCIERLELDVGNIKLERLEHDLPKAVAEALEKSLRELIPPGEPLPTIISGNVQYKTVQHSINEAFIHFLTTGTLPWSFRLPEGVTLEQAILGSWREGTKSGMSPAAENEAVLGVLASVTARKRLIRQFSPVFLKAFLSLLSPEGRKIMDEVLQLQHCSDDHPPDTKPSEQQLWETVFAKVAAGDFFSSTDLVDEAWRGLPITTAGHAVPVNELGRHLPTMSAPVSTTACRLNGSDPEPESHNEQGDQSHAGPGLPGNAEPRAQSRIEAKSQRPAEPVPSRHVEPEPQQHTEPELQSKAVISLPRFTEQKPQSAAEPGLSSNADPGSQCHDEPTPSRRIGPGPQLHEEPAPSRRVEPGPQRRAGAELQNRTGTSPSNLTAQGPQNHAVFRKTPINLSPHPEAGVGIHIENAGLVLLHPFLPRFFEALDIVAEDKLLQPERALCLLHFLTTGRLIAPEYDLVLPKILCNVPLLTPINSNVTLTATEQEEGVALLQAVIRHWEALRNTSPDGLRGTFLLRPGKVSLRDGGDWLLQVEAKSCDILLDSLPWGISMTSLPWMESMLWVEWR